LDERDFAELISVFLKGNEPDETSSSKEKKEAGDVSDEKQPSNEAEIRKNIIEALAEKIKESSDAKSPDNLTAEVALEEILPSGAAIEEFAAGEENSTPESPEEVVTQEEVKTLLSTEGPEAQGALRQILKNFTELDGVVAALVVSHDGFTVDYVSDVEFELDMVSAVIATGFNALDKIGHELNQGGLKIAMLEYEHGPVVVSPLVEDIVLVVVASQWTTLGRIRWEIKKRSAELIANL